MTTSKPLKGLMMFSYYQRREVFLGVILLYLALGGAWLAFPEEKILIDALIQMPLMIGYIFIVGMGSIRNWEKYQIVMPVSRKTLVASQMISTVLGMILGFTIVTIFLFISSLVHGAILFNTRTIILFIEIFNISLLFVALTFIFSFLPVLKGKETLALILAFICSVVIVPGLSFLSGLTGLSSNIMVLLITILSVLTFFAAYVSCCKMYAKRDF